MCMAWRYFRRDRNPAAVRENTRRIISYPAKNDLQFYSEAQFAPEHDSRMTQVVPSTLPTGAGQTRPSAELFRSLELLASARDACALRDALGALAVAFEARGIGVTSPRQSDEAGELQLWSEGASPERFPWTNRPDLLAQAGNADDPLDVSTE